MRIAILTVQVPFITGGAETLARSLRENLCRRGHLADIVSIPFKWYPLETLLECMVMGSLVDVTETNGHAIDAVIALKFPAYLARHKSKVVWLLHQHRQVYDLWQTKFGDVHTWPNAEYVRRTITENDREALSEACGRFTISRTVTERLRRFNGLDSTPLYHPPDLWSQLRCSAFEPFVFYPSRITAMKRQSILIEAAAYLRTDMKVVISGAGDETEMAELERLIERHGVRDKVRLTGHISDEEKVDLYARASAVYFGGYDEDYGYVVLEAMFARKPVLALNDTGGALEFVSDGVNGFVINPDPRALAEKIDAVRLAPDLAARMGDAGRQTMSDLNVGWDFVIDTLTRSVERR
jgi:glycosyltransferase involved in cell wall biosynthesis